MCTRRSSSALGTRLGLVVHVLVVAKVYAVGRALHLAGYL